MRLTRGMRQAWRAAPVCAALQATSAFAQAAPAPAPDPAGVAAACSPRLGADRPWLDRSLPAECRADLLIARIGGTEAKLKTLATGFAAYGFPPQRSADGPVGPTRGGNPISLPAPLAMAASFDPALVAQAGTLVGREFRAGGLTRMLGPTLDISRTWHFGRTAENFGEDPVLTTSIAVPYVRAIQAEGVVTTLKHFAVYGQEQGRTGDLPIGQRPAVNTIVSEKALRELYLPAFRAAVVEGGALGIMCSFPRINGVYACEHPHLLGILKSEWKFRGTVGPDFPDAQRSVVEAINAGLDSGNFALPRADPRPAQTPVSDAPAATPGAHVGEAPEGPPPGMMGTMGLDRIPGGIGIEQALREGRITTARLDDLLRRTLVSMMALDAIPASPVDAPAARALAGRIAAAGTVLLRNERGILPFGSDVRSLAVIGAQAGDRPQQAITGSAFIDARSSTSALTALQTRGAGMRIAYAQGNIGLDELGAPPPGLLRTRDGKPGLTADYVGNPNLDFAARPMLTRIEPDAHSVGSMPAPGLPADHQWSVRWSGRMVPRASGLHRFTISGAGSATLRIAGKAVARFARVDFGDIQHAAIRLEAGRAVELEIDYTPREAAPMPVIPMMGTTLGARFHLGLAEPDDRIERAVVAARSADVAVVFAAGRQGEGADRTTLNLPPDQDALIEAVAAANPRTVVVLSTGGPVAMPWLGKVAAVLETWYAGEAFGPAVAGILFGDTTPGGRLPISFPADATNDPGDTIARYPGLTNAQGQITDLHLDEGMLVGYRWHLAHPRQAPLFPFGYGLSYGKVALSGFAASAMPDGSLRIQARAANTGAHRAVEVVQAYLSLPGEAGQSIPKLAGFDKVALAPGEAREVTIDVPASRFDYWADGRGWTPWRGRYNLVVGRSATQVEFRQNMNR